MKPGRVHLQFLVFNTSLLPEDADSRTVFVSHVHFTATKEAITKHFSRYGKVLTDAATGQPKWSAYIAFSSKETGQIVFETLTLNETSFMS